MFKPEQVTDVSAGEYCISVPYPKLGQAETTEKYGKRGAAPSSILPVFSARPSLVYGTLTLYYSRSTLLSVLSTAVTLTNVTSL